MPDVKISQLPTATTPLSGDELVIVDQAGVTKIAHASDLGSGAPQGAQGPQGSNGSNGSQGSQGFQGSNGSNGSQGSQGFQGSNGSNGSQGSQGSQGANGSNGSQGSQGSQGANGSNGSQGSQGSQGAAGSNGSQGSQGSQGANGSNGSQGNQGAAGSQGSQGNQGTAGSQGSQGEQGPQGFQGDIGLIGNWTGQWTGATSYAVGDAVFDLGSSYIGTAPNFGNEPPSSGWDLVAEKGAAGATGNMGGVGSTWTLEAVGGTDPSTDGHFSVDTLMGSGLANQVDLITATYLDASTNDQNALLNTFKVNDYIRLGSPSGNTNDFANYQITDVTDVPGSPNFVRYHVTFVGGYTGIINLSQTYALWFSGGHGDAGADGTNGSNGTNGLFGGLGGIWFLFDTNGANPGAGEFTTNTNVGPGSITTLKIHATDYNSTSFPWDQATVGSYVRIGDSSSTAHSDFFRITSTSVFGSTYTIGVTYIGGFGLIYSASGTYILWLDVTPAYTATTALDWASSPPTTITEALDRLATATKTLNSGTAIA